MTPFEHVRHKPPTPLERPRELVIACAPLRSNVNLSRIVRTAGCCGVTRVIACGAARIIEKIARDSVDEDPAEGVAIETHRTLEPVLIELKREGYQLVGLEQTTGAEDMHSATFERRTALIIGNERQGLTDEVLRHLHRVFEIPVYGRPLSYNVATAAAMAMYEYCRQFPRG